MDYLSEKSWIEKSKTIIYAEWSKFDIYELQIFETYLSRINPRDPESSCVRFTRKEYAEMMGYADGRNLKTRTLDKWVKNFINKQVSIAYEGGTRHFNLFSDADVHTDPETGEVVIDLDCNAKLKPVFFNIAESGYISYRRKHTINFKSGYTLKLYCMLKDHAWGNYEWVVDLKELKNMLGAVEPLYEKFAEFNRRILKKAEEEINGNTDIRFTYERIVRGRITRGIKFKIQKDYSETVAQIPGQMEINDFPETLPDQPEMTMAQKYIKRVNEEAFNGEFSLETAEYLVELGSKVAQSYVSADSMFDLDAAENMKIKYYRERYLYMNANAKSTTVKSRASFLEKVLKGDAADSLGFNIDTHDNTKYVPKPNRFNNFENRSYDWNELEKMLLETK